MENQKTLNLQHRGPSHQNSAFWVESTKYKKEPFLWNYIGTDSGLCIQSNSLNPIRSPFDASFTQGIAKPQTLSPKP